MCTRHAGTALCQAGSGEGVNRSLELLEMPVVGRDEWAWAMLTNPDESPIQMFGTSKPRAAAERVRALAASIERLIARTIAPA